MLVKKHRSIGKYLVSNLVYLICIFYFSCSSTPSNISPWFLPIKDESIIVVMNNGKETVYINAGDFDMRIQQIPNERGMISFVISIRNNMTDSIINSRYEDFKLEYINKDNEIIYIPAFNSEEFFNKYVEASGINKNYITIQQKNDLMKHYFMENDIRANGGESVGVLSFDYVNTINFKFNITIKKENFMLRNLRNEGQISIQNIQINYKIK